VIKRAKTIYVLMDLILSKCGWPRGSFISDIATKFAMHVMWTMSCDSRSRPIKLLLPQNHIEKYIENKHGI
jgi:hypothetical protein